MAAYYNEIDPFAAQWLRNLIAEGLIAPGDVDERDIKDVVPTELTGYVQCHFFAGIGGWSLALRLAGWPDERPAWTGSCPCQPFSSAARGRNNARDCWPDWLNLISTTRPGTIFGEQVAAAKRWFCGARDDLEAMGYAVGAANLPACSVGQDHARPRIYFVGHTNRNGESSLCVDAKMAGLSGRRSNAGDVALKDGVPARMGRLRAYGNAIVPQVAAQFIAAFSATHSAIQCHGEANKPQSLFTQS